MPTEPKTFEIWCEGYQCTGDFGTAHLFGTAQGANFTEACKNFFRSRPDLSPQFNSAGLTFWGCRLFDNEADARKGFG